jgi:hypothetical protein
VVAGWDAALESVDADAATLDEVAGGEFLAQAAPGSFDFVVADAWAGKYTHLDLALGTFRARSIYLSTIYYRSRTGRKDTRRKVPPLVESLERREGIVADEAGLAVRVLIAVRLGQHLQVLVGPPAVVLGPAASF